MLRGRVNPRETQCGILTAFTGYRHILKTVKNVTVAKFEETFIRYQQNLKEIDIQR